jgi:UPF0755 protein
MRRIVFKLLGLLVLAASFGGGWLLLDVREFLRTPLSVGNEGAVYVVRPGTSLSQLARGLQHQGIITHPHYLAWLARWHGQAQHIRAGEYRIDPGTTPEELLEMLVAGKVILHSLTIIEGTSFQQMMATVRADEALEHTLKELSPDQIMAKLGHADQHPEGLFYPDTYRFPRGTLDVEFLARAYNTMQQRLDREWESRDPNLPLNTPYEALILASIVEKESALPEERSRIAGVFVRRLRRGMRLQTDPTVIYGLGDSYDGNIRSRDLRKDTPYNTYTRNGLPPTPIAMPSGDSIHAALHPAPGKALYFVAKGDGSHHFSATLEEHNRAVIKYQLSGKTKPFSSSVRGN